MRELSEIFIKNYKCLNGFSLDLNKKAEKETLNLNLLVGKNGAGKSTFLDALYEIATHMGNPDVIFQHYIKDNIGELICGNCSPRDYEKIEPEPKHNFWKKVIKFYTGNSNRNIEYFDNITADFMSFEREEIKYVLSALFLSGAWTSNNNKKIIDKFKKIIFKNEATFEPFQVCIDVRNYDEETFPIKNINFEKKREFDHKRNFYKTRLTVNIDKIKNTASSFTTLGKLLDNTIEEDSVNRIIDTGFLYKKLNKSKDEDKFLHIDESLSDGELGFIRRFALIMLMRELNGEENRSLLLLDEPETHFNENWKRHFIYLIKEALKDTYHDVFIATHSAMLITDVKRDELYHFELVNDKIKTFPVCLNTYATNIVDIGKALFDLEADIGEYSKNELENLIKGIDITTNQRFKTIDKHKQALQNKLKEVGPGEWRWKIRSKINQLEKADSCCNYKNKENNDHDS